MLMGAVGTWATAPASLHSKSLTQQPQLKKNYMGCSFLYEVSQAKKTR